jgi:hypothetical protein
MSVPDCVFIDVQGFFHQHGIIVSGIDGRPVMMGSYMSVIDHSVFKSYGTELLDAFGSDGLREAALSFRNRGYLGIVWTAAAVFIEDLVKNHPNHLPVDPENIGEPVG